MKTVLITGTSSGIGWATAVSLAKDNSIGKLIICGRRADRLEALTKKVSSDVAVHSLCFDIVDREAVSTAMGALPADFAEIDVLINNAGNAHGLDPIQSGSIEDWEQMIDINLKGVLYMSRIVSERMAKRGRGQIINIGSIAGKEAYPSGNVYCATKAAIDSLTQGMRIDLYESGVRVGVVHPGLVETEFSEVRFKGDSQRASSVYANTRPLTAEDVAETIRFVIGQPEHVNLAEVLVMPTDQASAGRVRRDALG
jgi:3-hydroxy acid dehydrogenase/malonic semialdehyde reductase